MPKIFNRLHDNAIGIFTTPQDLLLIVEGLPDDEIVILESEGETYHYTAGNLRKIIAAIIIEEEDDSGQS